MNNGRLIAAGLLAGLVLNLGEGVLHAVVVADQTTAVMTKLNGNLEGTPLSFALLVAVTFAQGLLGMWLYATTRHSAVVVGLVVWFLSAIYSALYLYAGFPGVFPDGVVWWPVLWELVQYPLAMIVGALVYKKS